MPPTKRIAPRTDKSEEKIRARIRKAFLNTGRGKTAMLSKPVEDQILALMKEYVVARKDQRELIYRKGEKRILRTLRSKGA